MFNLTKPFAICVLLTEHTYKFLSVLQPPATSAVPTQQTGGVGVQFLLLVCGAFPWCRGAAGMTVQHGVPTCSNLQ